MKSKNSRNATGTAARVIVLSLVFLGDIKCDAFVTPNRSYCAPASLLSDHRLQQHADDRNTDYPIVESALGSSSPRSIHYDSANANANVNGNGNDNANDKNVRIEESIPSRSLVRRRSFATSAVSALSWSMFLCGATALSPGISHAEEVAADPEAVQVVLTGDVKKLFNEGRAREEQGNIPAATRIYSKVTKIAPKFIYGWSNLGNTQVALGELQPADESYTTAINLCVQSRKQEEQFGVPRCNDYYLLLLNRGTLRLNDAANSTPQLALADLERSASLRGKPDPLVLQNRARARELNGLYGPADDDYTLAISMTSNEVTPVWLRSAMVRFQLGDGIGALDLLRRVETKYPDVPEVRVAVAAMVGARGDLQGARRKLMGLPQGQRVAYMEVDGDYVRTVVAWPPKMIEAMNKLVTSVQDSSPPTAAPTTAPTDAVAGDVTI